MNIPFPYCASIQKIIRKYIGLDRLVATNLERFGMVSLLVPIGDCATGKDSGTIIIDIFVKNLNVDYLKTLFFKIETINYKQVDFSIKTEYPDPKGLILY